MNHLEKAKEGLAKMQGWYDDGESDTYDFNTMLLTHALISIAESLEKIAKDKDDIYNQGYDSGWHDCSMEHNEEDK